MTHAESRELLLDLAYGELDPLRAADLEAHLAGCAECQREKLALDETRRMTAALREPEEPPAGFDARVLEAARAQAQLDHGSIGEVIEVAGSVRPVGVEPASIDAHAAPRPVAERRKPRWGRRAALGGSIAAAAALVLVTSLSLQNRREAAGTAAAQGAYEIRIAPVQQATNEAVPEAKKEAQRDNLVAPNAAPPPDQNELAKKAIRVQGSGGDSAGADKPAVEHPRPAQAGEAPATAAQPAPAERAEPERARPSALAARGPVAQSAAPPAAAPPAAAPLPPPKTVAAEPAAAAKRAEVPAAGDPAARAAELERQAADARHAGDYSTGARLYQDAAALRDAGQAAWDLAHAVECLAAIGDFENARQLRARLGRAYPSEKTAYSAALRALREVDHSNAKQPPSEGAVPADF